MKQFRFAYTAEVEFDVDAENEEQAELIAKRIVNFHKGEAIYFDLISGGLLVAGEAAVYINPKQEPVIYDPEE